MEKLIGLITININNYDINWNENLCRGGIINIGTLEDPKYLSVSTTFDNIVLKYYSGPSRGETMDMISIIVKMRIFGIKTKLSRLFHNPNIDVFYAIIINKDYEINKVSDYFQFDNHEPFRLSLKLGGQGI